jgi:hypothetical protein
MPPLLEISINRRQSTQRRGEKEEKPLEMSTNKKKYAFFSFIFSINVGMFSL